MPESHDTENHDIGQNGRFQSSVSNAEIWKSSFLNAYLCGYPRYLETNVDPRAGGPIRLALLRSVLECSALEAQFRFDAFRVMMEQEDRQTSEAFQLAASDGSHYFKALIAGVEADEESTSNLVLAIRALDRFPELPIPNQS